MDNNISGNSGGEAYGFLRYCDSEEDILAVLRESYEAMGEAPTNFDLKYMSEFRQKDGDEQLTHLAENAVGKDDKELIGYTKTAISNGSNYVIKSLSPLGNIAAAAALETVFTGLQYDIIRENELFYGGVIFKHEGEYVCFNENPE